ncbi:MAG: PDZ domain-containing protein, partial [Bacteroidota bacterium]
DYVYSGKGMRVDSVIEGRPGYEGGMEGGDVILRIGDHEVADIYGYMEGLSKFQKGQTTTVVVQRGEEEKTLEITF